MTDQTSSFRRTVGSWHVVVAAVILLAAALGMNAAINAVGGVLAKANVPLAKPLEEFPELIGNRYILARQFNDPDSGLEAGKQILTSDVVETLGTEDYISWFFIDTRRSTRTSTAYVRLHMAYYTDLLDAVPHVPENCQVAGGSDRDLANDKDLTWTLPEVPAEWEAWKQVQVRQRGFVRTVKGKSLRSTVLYLFCANGQPLCSREAVAASLSSFSKKYCYYMKIEMSVGRTGQAEPFGPAETETLCREFFQAAAPAIFQHVASSGAIEQMESSR